MELLLQTVCNVVILSSVFVLASLGFAFLFNTLGIINLAHGSIYMVSGYLAYLLIVSMGLGHFETVLLLTGFVGFFGIVIEKYCFRPFVSDLNKIIIICVAIDVALTTTVNIGWGTKSLGIPTFTEGVLKIGNAYVRWDKLWTAVVGLSALGSVTVFIKKSLWGQQLQAVSQNILGATLVGIDTSRISSLASALGFGLAALAGYFMGVNYSLGPFMAQSMLVKILMVVMLAGVGSFDGIFLVGLILGTLYSVLPLFFPGAMSDAIAAVIVLSLLLFRPLGFFGRESDVIEVFQSSSPAPVSSSLGRKHIYVGLAILSILCLTPIINPSPYFLHVLNLTFIYLIASLSFRLVLVSGQFPLAHAGFMGIGAYSSAMMSKWLGLPPLLTVPLSAFGTCLVGVGVGYPFCRLRALYYAMGSLFFGVVIVMIISAGGIWTGGYSGLTGIPPLFSGSEESYYYFFLGIVVFSIVALYRLEFCRIGVNLKAIAQSYLAASSIGIDEGLHRVTAMGVGCFFAGLAGALYAHYNLVLSPSCFDLGATLWLFMYTVIGGISGFCGPMLGTAVLIMVPEFLRFLKAYCPYVAAGLLVVVLCFFPQGLVGVPELFRKRRRGALE